MPAGKELIASSLLCSYFSVPCVVFSLAIIPSSSQEQSETCKNWTSPFATAIMSEMLSVTISKYSKPDGYELTKVAKPAVEQPTDVLIKVRAASINPIDVKKADGAMKIAIQDKCVFPPDAALLVNAHQLQSQRKLANSMRIGSRTRLATTPPVSSKRSAAASRASRPATRSLSACLKRPEVPGPSMRLAPRASLRTSPRMSTLARPRPFHWRP